MVLTWTTFGQSVKNFVAQAIQPAFLLRCVCGFVQSVKGCWLLNLAARQILGEENVQTNRGDGFGPSKDRSARITCKVVYKA